MRQSAASKRDSSGGGGLSVLAPPETWSTTSAGRGLFGGGIVAIVVVIDGGFALITVLVREVGIVACLFSGGWPTRFQSRDACKKKFHVGIVGCLCLFYLERPLPANTVLSAFRRSEPLLSTYCRAKPTNKSTINSLMNERTAQCNT